MRYPLLLLVVLALTAVKGPAAPWTAPRGPEGTWYLSAAGERLTVSVAPGDRKGTYTATCAPDQGTAEPLEAVEWDPAARRLEFRRKVADGWQWCRASEAEGVLVGRFARSSTPSRPASLTAYDRHVTGWSPDVLDRDIVPRAYELLINRNYRGRLRLDRTEKGEMVGRLKVYSTLDGGSRGEELEDDLQNVSWDGQTLRFTRSLPGDSQEYLGTVSGRALSGYFVRPGSTQRYAWSGTRAEVLGYGLVPRSRAARSAWQKRFRKQIFHLAMAGNPQPLSRKVTVLRSGLDPFPSTTLPPDRDDNPAAHPPDYRLDELQLDYTLPNAYGGEALTRRVHGYLATPKAPVKGGRYPAVLSVNGHGGSAWKMMNPDDPYFWHGDGFARRGYVVLAIDISHRPLADRGGLYRGPDNGDDPAHGNQANPAIKAPGFDTDWEEDGERAWDSMRALDYLLSLKNVDPKRVLVTGISMGGEATTYVGALDPRLRISAPCGYSPDMGVILYNGNHPCWRYVHSDIREYFDISDFHALTAPRPLINQTGRLDYTFSRRREPFAADKQVGRRARAAYGKEADRYYHYLHYDQHHYHVGDVNPTKATEAGVRLPMLIEPPASGERDWQSDGQTKTDGKTLFELIEGLLK